MTVLRPGARSWAASGTGEAVPDEAVPDEEDRRVSGPVTARDAPPVVEHHRCSDAPAVDVTPAREAEVGGVRVQRALPRRARRTVGAWCFVDHMGPVPGDGVKAGLALGPHPHIGLQTVTWLLEGEVLHTDGLGSEQPIRPGQLNLMTAGRGVAHAEESRAGGAVHGVQLWVAQPDETRDGPPHFEHHGELPQTSAGAATATVLLGELAGQRSPGRVDSPIVGADLALRPGVAELPVEPAHEHALVVLEGEVVVRGVAVGPGALAYLGRGGDAVRLEARDRARALLRGGAPFEDEPLMWWNFVARTRGEIDAARADWRDGGADRFGAVPTRLPRIPAPVPTWARS
ncbi:MAG TPA: pirin family protein [Acidimicrobiales bacterium]